jgi:hypothetical protein
MTPPAKPRIPHADRPAVIAEFCTCLWVHTQNPHDPNGPALQLRHMTDPKCILHGENAERSPF